MSDSRLKNLDGKDYPSRIVRHSLVAGPFTPLTSQHSILGGTLSMFLWSLPDCTMFGSS